MTRLAASWPRHAGSAQLRAVEHARPCAAGRQECSRSPSPPIRSTTTATAAGHRHRPCRGLAERTTCCAPTRSSSTATPTSPPPPATSSCCEPDGQVVFADYAELTQGMKDGVLRDMRAILPAERQARRQRRAAHRGRDQRTVESRLFHLQPVRPGPDAAAAVADPRADRGAGPGAQEDRVRGRGDADVRHPGRLFSVFLDTWTRR